MQLPKVSHSQDWDIRYYFLKVLDVESKFIWEDKWRDNVSIASDHPKKHNVDQVVGFHQYGYILLGQSKATVVL